ncbi:hypothetical protein, partial [Brevibacterium sandarakinum]|uniref:hypothetical protein n=1 Tax=Brevibacterium sandarakinum TaxID=629680 RepID=UPI00264E54A9
MADGDKTLPGSTDDSGTRRDEPRTRSFGALSGNTKGIRPQGEQTGDNAGPADSSEPPADPTDSSEP